MLAAEVASTALTALAASSVALDTEAAVFEELVLRPASIQPVRPEAPKLLPAIHTLWAPLLGALRGESRPAFVERGLQLMTQAVQLGGGQFMARRFMLQAWPLLQRLMREGPGGGGSGGTSGGVRRLGPAACAQTSRELLAVGAQVGGGSEGE